MTTTIEQKFAEIEREFEALTSRARRYLARKQVDADMAEYERRRAPDNIQEQMHPKRTGATFAGVPGLCAEIRLNGGDSLEEFDRKPDKPLPGKLEGECTGIRFNGRRIFG